MGSICVRLSCGHAISTHTDDLLGSGWSFEKILARQVKRPTGKSKIDRVMDALDDPFTIASNPSIYPGEQCVACFAKDTAEIMVATANVQRHFEMVKNG